MIALTLPILVNAQQFSITSPNVSSCTGVLEDSGGPAATYEHNEEFTCTVCPTIPGSPISLNFIVFALSPSGPNPDNIVIWDGNSTGAPVMGIFSGNELQNMTVSASGLNFTGCLTVRFRSNSNGTGNFAAAISCSQACDEPTAQLAIIGGDTLLTCMGDSLSLDGSGSTAALGHSLIQWIWSNGSQTETSTSPFYSFANQEGGIQAITLQVMDDAGCISQPTVPSYALIADPDFTGTFAPTVLCEGVQGQLLGQAVQSPMIQNLSCSASMPIPDFVGMEFTSSIMISSGSPDEVITSADQLGDICLEMEHSFMGDIVIRLDCPNGQSVALHEQGGGGIMIGDANDSDQGNLIPGTCWNYCFNASPQFGTWEASAGWSPTPNVMQSSQGLALIPGSYTSVEPLSNLIGCPVNGSWTLTIVDLWAADNGYLCSWCMEDFNNDEDSVFFDISPLLGTGPDSVFWTGNGVVNDPNDAGSAIFNASGTGAFQATFTVVDTYGCAHDTVLTINVVEPVIDAGPFITLCDSIGSLAGSFQDAASPCLYELVLIDPNGGPWDEGDHVEVTIGDSSNTYSINTPDTIGTSIPLSVLPGESIMVSYFAGTNSDQQQSFELYDPEDVLLYASTSPIDTGVHYIGIASCPTPFESTVSWTPSDGLLDPASLTTSIFTGTSGWYVLNASFSGAPGCAIADSVWVEASGTGSLELIYDPVMMTLCVEPMDLASYDWYLDGILHSTTSLPCMGNIEAGSWLVIGTPDEGCVLGGDTVVCPQPIITQQDGTLAVPNISGTYTWTYQGNLIPDATGPVIELIDVGLYEVTIFMDNGCLVQGSYQVIMLETSNNSIEKLTFNVFPNPSHGTFNFVAHPVSGLNAIISIRDITGRLIHKLDVPIDQDRVNEVINIDTAPGNYLIEFRDLSSTRVKLLIVE